MRPELKPLAALLKRRGMNFRKLAKQVGISPAHFSSVLNGKRPGRKTWGRVLPLLDWQEVEMIISIFGPVFPPDVESVLTGESSNMEILNPPEVRAVAKNNFRINTVSSRA